MTMHPDTEKPLKFDDFEKRYNYDAEFKFNIPFFRIIKTLIAERAKPVTVLDIGCGEGIGNNKEMQRGLRVVSQHYWGVEPDPDVEIEPGLFDRVERSLLEDADLPHNSIDIAYAFMVMEHVQNPENFLHQLNEILKPGGVFVFASPNARHLFGMIAYWSSKLRIDQWLLGKTIDKAVIEDHHYELAYKINTASLIRKHAQAAGLKARIGYSETPQGVGYYFKGPLKIIHWLLIVKRRVWKNPASLCHIYGYIEKPRDS